MKRHVMLQFDEGERDRTRTPAKLVEPEDRVCTLKKAGVQRAGVECEKKRIVRISQISINILGQKHKGKDHQVSLQNHMDVTSHRQENHPSRSKFEEVHDDVQELDCND